MFPPPPQTCHVSCFMCHMSRVMTCHVSRVTCNFFSFFLLLFFRTKWWSLLVEGLLSTGPTPSSLLTIYTFQYIIVRITILDLARYIHTCINMKGRSNSRKGQRNYPQPERKLFIKSSQEQEEEDNTKDWEKPGASRSHNGNQWYLSHFDHNNILFLCKDWSLDTKH